MDEDDGRCVASRRPDYVAPSLVEPKPLRPGNRLFQKALTAESVPPAVPTNSQVVEFHNERRRNPGWLGTLPSVAQVPWPLGISESLQEPAVLL